MEVHKKGTKILGCVEMKILKVHILAKRREFVIATLSPINTPSQTNKHRHKRRLTKNSDVNKKGLCLKVKKIRLYQRKPHGQYEAKKTKK